MINLNLKTDATELCSAIERFNNVIDKNNDVAKNLLHAIDANDLNAWSESVIRYTGLNEATLFITPSCEFLSLLRDAERYCEEKDDHRIQVIVSNVIRKESADSEANIGCLFVIRKIDDETVEVASKEGPKEQDRILQSILLRLERIEAALSDFNSSQGLASNISEGSSRTHGLLRSQDRELL